MFILVQPMYSKRELNADSNYVVYTSLIRGMRRVRPDWHWVVIFPDASSGYRYEDDGFFRSPNVSRVPQRISPRKHANAVSYDGIWYDNLFRKYAFDAVWCNLVEVAAHVKVAGEGTLELRARPLLVAAHNYVIHRSLPYTFEAQHNVAFSQVMGGVLSDWNVFNSDHCRQMFVETAGEWLRRDVIDGVLARSSRIDYGTLEPGLAPVETGNETPVIAYNHRLQAYKNYDKTFELLAELHGEGVRFRVRYMNNTADMVNRVSTYPFVEVRLCRNRSEYLDALGGCDLNVTNSQHETFCIAAIESMALGQPLVAPDAITFPEITGRQHTKYPYLFRSREEQKDHLRRLLTDARERRRWGRILSDHVRRAYNQDLWARRYAELFESKVDAHVGSPEDARAFVAGVMRDHPGIEFNAFARKVTDVKVNGRVPFSNQSLPNTKALKLIRALGGRVVMEGGEQKVYPARS